MPRWLRVILWCLIGLELVYLVGVNLFLNLGGLSLAFGATNQVNASVSRAWSVWPGRVHASGVRFIFQDHNVQFSVDMTSAFMIISLSELPRQVFHASRLRGDGVVYRMRHRVDPWSKDDPDVGAYPPIPEYSTPAVFEARAPEAPLSDAEYNLWTVHFDDVDAQVSEVWVQAFRYRGNGRVRGRFQLKPARNLWVGPALLELQPGLLTAGAYRVAPGLRARIECTVHPFDVRPVKGFEPLRYISAHVRVDSPAFDPQAFALFSDEGGPRVSSASGSLHLDVETRHGVITNESRLDIVQRGFETRAVSGDLEAEQLELHAGIDERGSRATLVVDRGTVREPIAPGHAPGIEHLSAAVFSDNRDTSRPFQLREARLEDARVHLADANWLNRWVKSESFALSGGSLSANARARYADQVLDGHAQVEAEALAATLGEKRAEYSGTLSLELEHADLAHTTGKLSADLSGRLLRARMGEGGGDLTLEGLQARVQAHRAADGNNALEARAKLWNFRAESGGFVVRAPGLIAEASSANASDGAQLTHFKAELPSLSVDGQGARLTTGAQAHGTFTQQKNKLEQRLELWASLARPRAVLGAAPPKTFATPRVAVHAALRTDARGALSGTLDLTKAAWVVEADNLRLSGQSALAAQFAELDLARHSGELSAQLSSTGVTLGDTTQNANCPWSRVDALRLDGKARLLARGSTSLSLHGELKQSELNWGDFLTHGDIGLDAQFDEGLLASDGAGRVDLALRNATFQSGGGGAKGWAASVPALDISTNISRTAGKLSGRAHVKAPGARGRIGSTRVSTDLDAKLEMDALDLIASTIHGSGAVHLRNTSLPNAPDPISNWWADVKLDSLFARAQKNLELGGTFRANLRDATPGLAVLSSQGALPAWVASAFPLRALSVTGSLARRCRLTDIHLVQVSGGPAVARGRLQSVPDGFQGALLVRLSGLEAVSAGIDFDAEHTHFGMFRGDDWLSRFERSFDRQSENAVNLVCPPDPNTCTEPEAVSVATREER